MVGRVLCSTGMKRAYLGRGTVLLPSFATPILEEVASIGGTIFDLCSTDFCYPGVLASQQCHHWSYWHRSPCRTQTGRCRRAAPSPPLPRQSFASCLGLAYISCTIHLFLSCTFLLFNYKSGCNHLLNSKRTGSITEK